MVKLVQKESESAALRRYLRRHRADARVTSALARVEVVRAVLPGGSRAITKARRVLALLHQVNVDSSLLDSAATIGTGTMLRRLDAIHLASAQIIGGDLRAVVTYDLRMAAAATTIGLPLEAPS